MGLIQQLPEDIAIKIAAGEVVERPASVVKELVENALDAGATRVEAVLRDGGKTDITIKDNGSGMDREDAVKAFLRHGTSKIRSVDDLLSVATLGFRGEALAAIAASAEGELITTLMDATEGTVVTFDHGDVREPKPHAPLTGTTVRVSSLFASLPARQKFLKTDATEWKACLETLVKQMIVHPDVAFVVKHNNRVIYDLPQQLFAERVAAIWNVAPEVLIPVACETPHLSLIGVVAKPEFAHGAKPKQFFAVNGHPVTDKMVARSIKDAFGSLLPPTLAPSYALNLSIHPGMVDVNIHPRKDEVRFVNGQEVFRFVFQAVSQSLSKVDVSFQSLPASLGERPVPVAESKLLSLPARPAPPAFSLPASTHFARRTQPVAATASLQVSHAGMRVAPSDVTAPLLPTAPVLTLDNCFLVTLRNNELLLIDQHAAHERILYNKLWQQDAEQAKAAQSLLLPAELNLSETLQARLNENREAFESLGFAFTENPLSLTAVPSVLKVKNASEFFYNVLEHMDDERPESELTTFKHRLFATMACKAAVKAGDALSEIEKQRLVEDLFAAPNFTCPHGRPSHISVGAHELEKLFKRTGF